MRSRGVTLFMGLLMMVAMFASPAMAQTPRLAQPEVGAAAPPLNVTHLLQVPEGTPAPEALSWKDFEGKAVVLEFWATWCGPCIAAIPHLNKLADEFKDDPVRFISITDEGPEKVEPFLAKRPMRSWLAMDTTRATARAFGVRGIPMTVLIDREGKVAAVTYPTAVDATVLNDLIAGRPVKATGGRGVTAGEVPDEDPYAKPPIFQVRIRPALVANSMSARSGGKMTALGMDVVGLVSLAYGFPARNRIEAPDSLGDEKYEVVISVPEGRDELFESVFQTALRASLGVTARRMEREIDVYILSARPGAAGLKVGDANSGSRAQAGPGILGGQNIPASEVLRLLEQALQRPVVDEIGLSGRYTIEIRWEPAEEGGAAKAFMAATGLDLSPGVRVLPVLVVEKE